MRKAWSVSVFARDSNGRVLLIKHKRLGTWLPPGGEVEDGESPQQAASRELLEETGLVARFVEVDGAIEGAPTGLIAYEEHDAGSKGLHMNFCFLADVDGDVVPNEEFDEHAWVDDVSAVSCPKNVAQLIGRVRALSNVDVAQKWLSAFNARDLDGLLALYADDAVHISPKLRDRKPETKGEIRGKSALRAWWADAFARLPGLAYDERAITTSHDRVVLEYLRRAPGEADLVVAESYLVKGGLIVESRVFHG
jgi:ADP-ribose pyrophosphatase YjhB (NUDIX family)